MAVGPRDYIDQLLVKKYAEQKVNSTDGIEAVSQEDMLAAMHDFSDMNKNMMVLNNKLSSICAAVNAVSAQYKVSRFARA